MRVRAMNFSYRGWSREPVAWAGMLFAVCVAAIEILARWVGHVPSVNDDQALWAAARDRMRGAPLTSMVIAGASRSAYAFDPTELSRCFRSFDVVQLSVRGGGARPIVRELSLAGVVPGVLLISLAGPSFEDIAEQRSRAQMREWTTTWKPARAWERKLSSLLDMQLAMRRQNLEPTELYGSLRETGSFPRPDLRYTDESRFVYAPRQWLIDQVWHGAKGWKSGASLRRRRVERHVAPPEWSRRLSALMLDIAGFVDQGVEVIVLRLPSSGPVRGIEEELYPRGEYWQQVERHCHTIGCNTVHFDDWPQLHDFEAPDGSHLSGEQRREFTTSLCGVVDQVRAPGADELALAGFSLRRESVRVQR